MPKQGTNPNSKFLKLCEERNAGAISEQQLVEGTVKLGFNNVIEAFHNLGEETPGLRFFVDERRQNKGIRITENLGAVLSGQAQVLEHEVEARWRLVETAWSLGLAVPLIEHEHDTGRLVTGQGFTRIDVTSSRDALNGYQKGQCFYCAEQIGVEPGAPNLAHVDHFIPFVLSPFVGANLNGVWNLVLACADCNLSKLDRVPRQELVYRLIRRNEFFINSHHPLRETLIVQLGMTARAREESIGKWWSEAYQARGARWPNGDPGKGIL